MSEWLSDVPKPSQDEKKKRINSEVIASNNEIAAPSSSNAKPYLAFKPMSIKRPSAALKPNSSVFKPANNAPKVETSQVSASNNGNNSNSNDNSVSITVVANTTIENTCDDEEDYSINTFDVSDPYDPARPNDYNQHCIEREEKKRLSKLAELNSVYIQEMETQRREKELERIAAAERGDVRKLQELDNGRGRGRGLSNLPAWMTRNESHEAENKDE